MLARPDSARRDISFYCQEAVQEIGQQHGRQLRLYFHARAVCAPRSSNFCSGETLIGEDLLFQNFQREALVQLHSRSHPAAYANGFGRASPAARFTLPKSSGCTRSSTTVACGPSPVSTFNVRPGDPRVDPWRSAPPVPSFRTPLSSSFTCGDQADYILRCRTPLCRRGVAKKSQKHDAPGL